MKGPGTARRAASGFFLSSRFLSLRRSGSAGLALRAYVCRARLHDFLHESRWYRLVQWKPDRPFGRVVFRQLGRVRPPDLADQWIKARVILPARVPDENLSVEPEGGNAVAPGLGRAGRSGANQLAESLQRSASPGR